MKEENTIRQAMEDIKQDLLGSHDMDTTRRLRHRYSVLAWVLQPEEEE